MKWGEEKTFIIKITQKPKKTYSYDSIQISATVVFRN